MSYGDKVKDVKGIPVFSLVNRVTREALQNPAGENEEVSLVPYNTNRLDDSVKWTEMWSTGFRAIRIADTTSLNLTAISSDIDNNFSDGDKIVVKKWINSPVQRWMIVPNVPCLLS
ncbi:ricin B-like lectin R40G2 [Carex rostrata]